MAKDKEVRADDLEEIGGAISQIEKTREKLAQYLLAFVAGAVALHYLGQVFVFYQFTCQPIVSRTAAAPTIDEINALRASLETCVIMKREAQAAYEKIFATWFGPMIAIIGSAVAFFYSRD